jgi:hypothetical protein
MAINFGNRSNSAANILNNISSSSVPVAAQAAEAGKTVSNLLGAVDLTGVDARLTTTMSTLAKTADLTSGVLDLNKLNPLNGLSNLAKKFQTSIPDLNLEDIANANAKGIDLTNIEKIPACAFAPLQKAKDFPELPKVDYEGKSPTELAKMFGVSDPSKIPGIDSKSLKDLITPVAGLVGTLLAAKNVLATDLTALRGKFESVTNQLSSVSAAAPQSREALQSNLGITNSKSAAFVFGSRSASNSTIDKLVPVNTQYPGP